MSPLTTLDAPTSRRAELSARQMTLLLWAVGWVSAAVWADSIGRYLQARYHLAPDTWWAAGGGSAHADHAAVLPPGLGAAGDPGTAGRGGGGEAAGTGKTPAPGSAGAGGSVRGASPSLQGAASDAKGAGAASPSREGPRAQRAEGPGAGASGAATGAAEPLPPGEFLPTVQAQRLRPGPQRVLFAGDSMMQGVAPLAIQALRKQYPDWVFHDLSRESTGLTVRRVFDWPARILEEMEARKLTLVVIFLGPNDPWDIYEKRQVLRFPSAAWETHYAARVAEILREAVAREVRVVWMGLPSMRTERLHQGAVVQNRVFHTQALAHGTDFLATEPLLGILSHPYRKTGGQDPERSASLRAEDGIHFTPTGQRLLRDALVQHLVQAAGGPP